MTVMKADLVREGQQDGEIRAGDSDALAHLASVLINEFALDNASVTSADFHAVFDGSLRAPQIQSAGLFTAPPDSPTR